MRAPALREFLFLPQFAVSTLGACKHIDALLIRLRRRFGRSEQSQKPAGETLAGIMSSVKQGD